MTVANKSAEKFVYVLAMLAICLVFSGCASVTQKKEMSKFNNLYCNGDYLAASETQIKKSKMEENKTIKSSELLPALQSAASLRAAKKYDKSTAMFDQCEEIIKVHNEQLLMNGVASNVGATLVNDAVLDYRGTEYDGIMVNTYKALNFWQMGQKDLARVEFNRALDRQRRAKERFSAEIKKQKESLKKKQEEENKKALARGKDAPTVDIAKNTNNPEIDNILKDKYSTLYEYKTYPNFVNPLTTYVSSLFFMSEGEIEKASSLMKETYGMVDGNTFVYQDFSNLEKMSDGEKNFKHYTWVIFENGLGPEIEELRVDLPILLFTEKVKYTGIALPKLKFRKKACAHINLRVSDKETVKTTTLSSMDRVVQTEFKKKYPTIVTRAIVSSLFKTYAQYVAQKELGDLGGFAAALYQITTTSADIRMWTALPKEFQLAKIETPANGILTLDSPDARLVTIEIPKDSNSLVYVKLPSSGASLAYDVIKM